MRWLNRKTGGGTKSSKRQSSRNKRRKPFAPRWVRPTAITVVLTVSLGIIVGGPIWLWQSGWVTKTTNDLWQGALLQSRAMGLSVQEVQLEGRINASKSLVIKTLGLSRGDPILGFDITAARQRLLALPWIREASIKRRLPDTIQISITERQPMALWQRKGRLVLVDTYGEVVTRRKLSRFRNLIIIVGKDAPRHAATLFAMLDSEPLLARKVTAAVRVGERRWNVRLKPGIRVQLPERDPHLAWQKLARMDQRHRLLSRDVKTIDLRLPNKLIVEPGALGSQLKGPKSRKGRNT